MNGNESKQNVKQIDVKTENGPDPRPLWQKISGIDPANEAQMDAEARDTAIRKLVQEVEKRAAGEFERAEAGRIPEGERTVFWDPLARVCLQLGISRTKLSAYSRELTGMRAHEISDRILAKRALRPRMMARVERLVRPELEAMRVQLSARHMQLDGNRIRVRTQFVRWMRASRQKEMRARFAAELGFANPSRLSRACLLAHGMSIDEMEAQMVCTMVQKFFGELGKGDLTQRREVATERHTKEERVLTADAQKVIDEAVAAVVGAGTRLKVAV